MCVRDCEATDAHGRGSCCGRGLPALPRWLPVSGVCGTDVRRQGRASSHEPSGRRALTGHQSRVTETGTDEASGESLAPWTAQEGALCHRLSPTPRLTHRPHLSIFLADGSLWRGAIKQLCHDFRLYSHGKTRRFPLTSLEPYCDVKRLKQS